MKYNYQYHDGDDWVTVTEYEFDTPNDAKIAGISAGFEYVRVVVAKP